MYPETFTRENLLYLNVIYRRAIKHAPRIPGFIRLRITSIYLPITYFLVPRTLASRCETRKLANLPPATPPRGTRFVS